MSAGNKNRPRFRIYEYLIYWPITLFILLLAFPLLLVIFLRYLIRSTGAPLKSVKNLVGFVLTLLLLSGGYLTLQLLVPYNIGSVTRSVMVEEEDLFSRISAKLRDKGVIKSEFFFKALAVGSGIDRFIAAGRYDFKGNISLYEVLMRLKRQEVATAFLTIPEGSNIYKIGSILAADLEIDSAAFVNLAFDTAHTMRLYRLEGLEGYLFPDSYKFRFGIKIERICEVLIGEFYKRAAALLDTTKTTRLSAKEILTLASIIEAEALHDDELPVISSVYHNRLRLRMPLQADPTVLYALGQPSRAVLYSDLKVLSPYNTYKIRGLPPGPINSPGLAAIRAALNPAQSDYLYFVADGSGRHIFSRTLAEHNRAKRKAKALRKILSQG